MMAKSKRVAKRESSASARDIRVVLVTAPPAEAENIARKLLEERLIACANLLPGVTSLYWWENKIQRDGETLIVMKTAKKNVARLLKRIKELHSYTVPEFLALQPLEGNADYLNWVEIESSGK